MTLATSPDFSLLIVDHQVLDEGEAFKSHGGFKHLDKVFDGGLEQILGDLRDAIWKDAG